MPDEADLQLKDVPFTGVIQPFMSVLSQLYSVEERNLFRGGLKPAIFSHSERHIYRSHLDIPNSVEVNIHRAAEVNMTACIH